MIKIIINTFYCSILAALIVLVSAHIYLTRHDGVFVDGIPTYKYKTSAERGYATYYKGKYIRNYGRKSVSVDVPSRFKEPVSNAAYIILIIISYVAIYHGAKLSIETDKEIAK
jgi:hypothetical protein